MSADRRSSSAVNSPLSGEGPARGLDVGPGNAAPSATRGAGLGGLGGLCSAGSARRALLVGLCSSGSARRALLGGLCSSGCTEITDVETAANGLPTHDRQVAKADTARVEAAAQALLRASRRQSSLLRRGHRLGGGSAPDPMIPGDR
ncbi:hypothetical protein ACH4KN_30495 [Streptomyces sp. NPDC017546]|uniref:hypothetical protein n=1 Tax=Streptomyces sp. NPDC017546 TaxID=3365001 RepID=UPI0037A2F307